MLFIKYPKIYHVEVTVIDLHPTPI